MREQIRIQVQRLDSDVKLPTYATYNDSGADVYANVDLIINPNETVILPTGLKVAIPDGFEIQVRPRSGLSFKTPLRIANAPGTIDSGYRNEVGVIITNTSNLKPIKIEKGERIAQFVLQRVPKIVWEEVEDINDGVDRGGGFGSTGT